MVAAVFRARVGRKYAVYLPRAVVEAVGLREGDGLLIRVEGGRIVLELVRDPIRLALAGRKFASVSPEEVEAVSLEEQARYGGSA